MSTSSFKAFLAERERISVAYINGDGAPLASIATTHDPSTFMPPSGAFVCGASAVTAAHTAGAKSFAEGSTGSFDIAQSGADGDLGFWTGLQHAQVMMQGKDAPVAMTLRTTEVFRREDNAWKLVHRHADMLQKED